jgi:hypothetical protein
MLSSSSLTPRPFPLHLLYPVFRTPMDPAVLDSSDFPAIHPNIVLGDSFPRLFDLPPQSQPCPSTIIGGPLGPVAAARCEEFGIPTLFVQDARPKRRLRRERFLDLLVQVIFGAILGGSGNRHICIVIVQPGSITVSQTFGRIISPLGPMRS